MATQRERDIITQATRLGWLYLKIRQAAKNGTTDRLPELVAGLEQVTAKLRTHIPAHAGKES